MTGKDRIILNKTKSIETINKELGPLDMTVFIRQFVTGTGDYTKEKDLTHKNTTIKDILEQEKTLGKR